ncbi:MAG: carbohydrate ABC transporter permease [Elusimicrobia bacterium]|nr:carbohydrate ABC transporter permease [Elusimicrobiota bacterium]
MNPKTSGRSFIWRAASLALLAAAILAVCFPLYWLLITSVKFRADQMTFPPVWIPARWTLGSFHEAFVVKGFGAYFVNSLVYAGCSTFLSVALGSLAGYSLARFKFPGQLEPKISFWILSTRMFPPVVSLIPLYFLIRKINLLDTPAALIALYAVFNLPFVVWMTRSFFKEIPVDLEEAAMVDGLTRFQAFGRVTLRLAAPGLAATAILCFIASFNEFIFALTLTTLKAVTLPVGIAGFVTQYKVMWGEMAAAGLVAAVPVVVFSLLAGRHMVKGLTMGAVKG